MKYRVGQAIKHKLTSITGYVIKASKDGYLIWFNYTSEPPPDEINYYNSTMYIENNYAMIKPIHTKLGKILYR